jgi:hypothetical protein
VLVFRRYVANVAHVTMHGKSAQPSSTALLGQALQPKPCHTHENPAYALNPHVPHFPGSPVKSANNFGRIDVLLARWISFLLHFQKSRLSLSVNVILDPPRPQNRTQDQPLHNSFLSTNSSISRLPSSLYPTSIHP